VQLSISGSSEYEAVVFPAPLQPDMMYSLGIFIFVLLHNRRGQNHRGRGPEEKSL
jgi:hypothetical protein